MDELTTLRINKIIELIDNTLSDLQNVSLETFLQSSLLQRATCFSIEQIGEAMKNLSKKLCRCYPNLPWNSAYATRIVIAHHYDGVDFTRIYNTAINDLPPLRKQLKDILSNDA